MRFGYSRLPKRTEASETSQEKHLLVTFHWEILTTNEPWQEINQIVPKYSPHFEQWSAPMKVSYSLLLNDLTKYTLHTGMYERALYILLESPFKEQIYIIITKLSSSKEYNELQLGTPFSNHSYQIHKSTDRTHLACST
ncbi:hypothetical protein CDAR_412471 [Caerostris darwini]|uniref:Uncharacterized protein n=1 Tax=Caerostris darwini TaxID=1538125 RepID=A0AAV4PZC1_9ARAC|nr:hypothetical protein CDAR_412471 [Caerostris darwini]